MPISTPSFDQQTTVTSLSMSLPVSIRRLEIRKILRPFWTSSHVAPMQAAYLQKDYMQSGREAPSLISWITDQNQFRICVPASDAIAGRLGDGVKDILALRNGEQGHHYFLLTSPT